MELHDLVDAVLEAQAIGGDALASLKTPTLVIGSDSGANPVSINGGANGLKLQSSLVIKSPMPGGKVNVAGNLLA